MIFKIIWGMGLGILVFIMYDLIVTRGYRLDQMHKQIHEWQDRNIEKIK